MEKEKIEKDKIIVKLINNLDITSLNEMQTAFIKEENNTNNTVLLSPTGSGKTLALLLSIYFKLDPNIKTIQCIIIVPSRELGLQIENVWKQMSTGYKVNICYGGHSMETELNNLSSPPAILIGTPGRLTDHLKRKSFTVENIKTLVLDEFDKCLQLGFHEDMQNIIEQLPALEKRILLSATSDIEIPNFTQITNPKILDFSKQKITSSQLKIKLVLSEEKDKINTLFKLICSLNSEPAIIFCNHREVSERISTLLNEKGVYTSFYHGGIEQDDRERVLILFRNGSLRYLVTTDLAARGLDINEMKHVIHYHLPLKESEFTHRNGRTARMNTEGTAYIIKFIEEDIPEYIPKELPLFTPKVKSEIPLLPEYETLYISGGKKNKISKVDIVGFFIQKGEIDKTDLGMIVVKDFISFVAIKREQVRKLLKKITDQKMKGKKYKIEIARKNIRNLQ